MPKNTNGHIYVIHLREFKRNEEPIYKIGHTQQEGISDRVKQYPKNSELLFCRKVYDSLLAEKCVLEHLRNTFVNRIDYGREYFEGNVDHIMDTIENVLLDIRQRTTHHTQNTNKQSACGQLQEEPVCEHATSGKHATFGEGDCSHPTFGDDIHTEKHEKYVNSEKNTKIPDQPNLQFLVVQFYNEKKTEYENKIVESIKVFTDFISWLQCNNHPHAIKHKSLTIALKDMLGIESRYHRFADGHMRMGLCFGNINSEALLVDFLEDEIVPVKDQGAIITSKEINIRFKKSKFYDGKVLHGKLLEKHLNSKVHKEVIFKGVPYYHCFKGFYFKDQVDHHQNEKQVLDLKEHDNISLWLSKAVRVTNNYNDIIPSKDLYEHFRNENRDCEVSFAFFGRQVNVYSGKKSINIKNMRCYRGLRIDTNPGRIVS